MEDYEAASRPLTNTSSKSFPGSFYAIHRRNMGWAYIRGKSMDKAVEHYGSISGYRSTLTDPSLVIDPHSLSILTLV